MALALLFVVAWTKSLFIRKIGCISLSSSFTGQERNADQLARAVEGRLPAQEIASRLRNRKSVEVNARRDSAHSTDEIDGSRYAMRAALSKRDKGHQFVGLGKEERAFSYLFELLERNKHLGRLFDVCAELDSCNATGQFGPSVGQPVGHGRCEKTPSQLYISLARCSIRLPLAAITSREPKGDTDRRHGSYRCNRLPKHAPAHIHLSSRLDVGGRILSQWKGVSL